MVVPYQNYQNWTLQKRERSFTGSSIFFIFSVYFLHILKIWFLKFHLENDFSHQDPESQGCQKGEGQKPSKATKKTMYFLLKNGGFSSLSFVSELRGWKTPSKTNGWKLTKMKFFFGRWCPFSKRLFSDVFFVFCWFLRKQKDFQDFWCSPKYL